MDFNINNDVVFISNFHVEGVTHVSRKEKLNMYGGHRHILQVMEICTKI